MHTHAHTHTHTHTHLHADTLPCYPYLLYFDYPHSHLFFLTSLTLFDCPHCIITQGARLTAFEIVQDGLPGTLIADSMASALMAVKVYSVMLLLLVVVLLFLLLLVVLLLFLLLLLLLLLLVL